MHAILTLTRRTVSRPSLRGTLETIGEIAALVLFVGMVAAWASIGG